MAAKPPSHPGLRTSLRPCALCVSTWASPWAPCLCSRVSRRAEPAICGDPVEQGCTASRPWWWRCCLLYTAHPGWSKPPRAGLLGLDAGWAAGQPSRAGQSWRGQGGSCVGLWEAAGRQQRVAETQGEKRKLKQGQKASTVRRMGCIDHADVQSSWPPEDPVKRTNTSYLGRNLQGVRLHRSPAQST